MEPVIIRMPSEKYVSKRKQYGWRQKAPVSFRTHSEDGISLLDALHGNVHNLLDRHEPILTGCGDKVSYHIHVCDFRMPFHIHNPTTTHPSPDLPALVVSYANGDANN